MKVGCTPSKLERVDRQALSPKHNAGSKFIQNSSFAHLLCFTLFIDRGDLFLLWQNNFHRLAETFLNTLSQSQVVATAVDYSHSLVL